MIRNHSIKSKYASSRSMPLTHRAVDGVFAYVDVFDRELASGETLDSFRVRVGDVDSTFKEVLSFRGYCSSRLGRDLIAARPQWLDSVHRFESEVSSFTHQIRFTPLSRLSTISTEEI